MSPLPATARVVDAPLEGKPARRAPRTASPPRSGHGWPLLRACRPRQWLKNAVVVIAPATAGAAVRPGAVPALLAAFVSFSLMSSATYLINDVRDRASDRRHPRKRLRPVAAGQLSPQAALRAAALLALAAALVASLEHSVLIVVVLGYGALTLSYTFWWREVVLLDIVAVAGGFVLRAVAGAAAVDVSLSRSFLVVTSACALFLVVGKRYAELLTADGPRPSRATLRRYTRRELRLLLAGTALLACIAYTSWSVSRPAHGSWLALSLIPFALWLGRYAALVRAGAGEFPEELVLHDNALVGLGLVWTLLFIAGIYGSS
jgi:decaprenyl-phosphate phosphoribosyltransferase